MNPIKFILGLAAVASLALFTPSISHAAFGDPTYGFNTIATAPATLATTVTTNFATPPVIDCRKQQNVALMFSFNQGGGDTSNVVYTLYRSTDGTIYDTNNPTTYTFASQGATRVNIATNLNTQGFGYYEIFSIANSTSLHTMTNFGVQYSTKISAP